MNAADHNSHGPKNSLLLRGHPHMHAYLHAAPEGIRNMGSSLDAQSSAQPILRGEVPTMKSTLIYVVGKGGSAPRLLRNSGQSVLIGGQDPSLGGGVFSLILVDGRISANRFRSRIKSGSLRRKAV